MKNLFAIAAITLLTSTAWADADSINSNGGMGEGNNAFDDVITATSGGGYYTSSSYDTGEGNDILYEAQQIASEEVLSSPTGVGDIDRLYAVDSAISDLLDAE